MGKRGCWDVFWFGLETEVYHLFVKVEGALQLLRLAARVDQDVVRDGVGVEAALRVHVKEG